MSSQLTIDLDLHGGLDDALRVELTAKAKTTVVLGLFEAGKVSSGAGARMLGITRRDFLDLLFEHKISLVDYPPGALEEEMRLAKELGEEIRRRRELGQ
jgi:predicted HTH domain antitoxin